MSSKKDDLKAEFPPDLIKGAVGSKYAECYKKGTNIMLMVPALIISCHDSVIRY
jgi:hypothetical protein